MDAPRQIGDLEIIGYANVLKETMVPSVVPPIFRVKAEPACIVFPPYTFSNGAVCNATEGTQHDLERLRCADDITLFDEPIPARLDFDLWVDQAMAAHYEPRGKVRVTLKTIATESIRKARQALAEGKLPEADRLAGAALSANDHLVEPLAIMAAVCRVRGDPTGEEVMVDLASGSLSAEAFGSLVAACLRNGADGTSSGGRGRAAAPPADLLRLRPMYGMAKHKTQLQAA
jgi:hypothetical protein